MFTDRQIRAFRAVLATGSVSAAAERLHLSQPSVTRLIAELEEAVGVPMFQRQARGMVPTEVALQFSHYVERHFSGLEALADIADDLVAGRRGRAAIGVIPAAIFEILPVALARIGLVEGNSALSVRVIPTDMIVSAVRAGQLDIGVVSPERTPRDVVIAFEAEKHHRCLIPPGHHLAGTTAPLTLENLRREPVVTVSGNAERALVAAGIGLRNDSAFAVDTSYAAASIALANNAIAVIDPFTAAFWQRTQGCTVHPLSGFPNYRLVAIRRTGDTSNIVARRIEESLLEELRTRCAAIV